MEPEFWHKRWHENQIGFHQTDINPWLLAHWSRLNLNQGDLVFVPLCGKSDDMTWLVEQGFRVVGVELSEKAIKAYFDQYDKNVIVTREGPFDIWKSENITIHKGDFFDLTPDHLEGVKAVFDRAALIALKPEMRRQYAQHYFSFGIKGARILLITLEYDQALKDGPPFSVADDEVNELFQAGGVALQQVSDVLEENQGFKNSGHTYLIERAYQITL